MSEFSKPDILYGNSPSPSTPQGLYALRENQKSILELPGALPFQVINIKDGILTIPDGSSADIHVDTEGGGAADSIVSISTSMHDGALVRITQAVEGRVVTLKKSTGSGGVDMDSDIVLSPDTYVEIRRGGNNWYLNTSIKLNNTVTSTSTTEAATANAVKMAYDESQKNNRNIGEVYIYTGADTPIGGLWYNSGATIVNADAVYPEFWKWLTGAPGANLRCTKAQQDADIATYGTSGRIAVSGTTLYMPTGVPSFFALAGPDKTPMSVEHDTGRNVTGSLTTILQDVNPPMGALKYEGGGYVAGPSVAANWTAGSVSLDASRVWGAEHTGDRFQPLRINIRAYIHVFSSAVPAGTAEAAAIIATAQQAATDVAGIRSQITSNPDKWASVLGMPSTSSINISVPSSATYITIPEDGYLSFGATSNDQGNSIVLLMNSKPIYLISSQTTPGQSGLGLLLPCLKGDSVMVYYSGSMYTNMKLNLILPKGSI